MSTSQTVVTEDDGLPPHITYWMSASAKHDCFFIVGSEPGSTKRIGAIKIFLVGHSEPLRSMLEDSDLSAKGDVTIVDVEPQTFLDFLKCIYGGTDIVVKNISFEESLKLLYVISKYLVLDLRPKIVAHIVQVLPKSVWFTLKALSDPVCFQDESLIQALSAIVSTHAQEIISHKHFVELSEEGLLFIVMQDSLKVHSELNVWEAVLKWAKYNTQSQDGETLRQYIIKFLKYIRFCTMSPRVFCKSVVQTNILKPDEVYEICKCFGTSNSPNLEFICNSTQQRTNNTKDSEINFYHFVNNVSNFNGNQKSISFVLDLLTWKILVKKNGDRLGLFLHCENKRKLPGWSCWAEPKFVLINQHGKPNRSMTAPSLKFCEEHDDWGFLDFGTWSKIVDPKEGFVKNDNIIIMVNLRVSTPHLVS